ncbi:ABC transporter permease, partial [Actinoalloteichus caeruleus]
MLTFLRRRVVSSAIPLVFVVLGVFCLARLTGNPVNLYLPLSATPEQRAEFAAAHGFDQPIVTQLADYLTSLLVLDFGESLRTGQPAAEMVLAAFPATLQLAGVTMLIAIAGAVLLGCAAAYRPNSLADRVASILSMTAASIPDFWFAIMGVLVFGVTLEWLPTSGVSGGPEVWIL